MGWDEASCFSGGTCGSGYTCTSFGCCAPDTTPDAGTCVPTNEYCDPGDGCCGGQVCQVNGQGDRPCLPPGGGTTGGGLCKQEYELCTPGESEPCCAGTTCELYTFTNKYECLP
jgi:hypothetical protein